MSRVGKNPVPILEKAKVTLEKRVLKMEGPAGKVDYILPEGINAEIKEGRICLLLNPELGKNKNALFGTTRARIANIMNGIVNRFTKVLEINGVGFKGSVQGQKLTLQLGFSHPVVLDVPPGMEMKFDPKATTLTISYHDKSALGNIAAKIKKIKPPEPYKGSGIKYRNERIIRKAGKAAAGVGKK